MNKDYLRSNKFPLLLNFLIVFLLLNLNNGILTIYIIMLILFASNILNNRRYRKIYDLYKCNKRRYKIAIEALDGAIWEWSSSNNKLFISKKIREILNIDKDIIDFDEWLSFVLEEEREDIRVFIENMIEKRIVDNFTLEYSLVDKDNNKLNVIFRGKGIINDDIYYLSGFITDNTEKIRIDNLNEANELAIEGSNDIVFCWNVNEDIISLGNGIKNYLNISGNGEILIPSFTWESYILTEDLHEYKNKINNVIKSSENEFYTIEYRILGKGNKVYWIEVKGKKTIKRNGDIFIHGTISEISSRIEKELEINYLTYNDEVTGIPNRRYFMKEATRLISEYSNENIAFIFIDLDNFKYVNNTYGHDFGDALLNEFSRIILDMEIDNSFFVRYGADEFILVKSKIKEKNEIRVILDEIIKKISSPLIIKKREINSTISIGISIYPFDGNELGILLKRADMAIYLAKANGKNRYEFFDLKLLEGLEREFIIEKGLRIAIDNEEIKLLYQPKVEVNSGIVVGIETLVRWHSKNLGIVPPNEFIPIAENSGLIIPIGKYIIDESFKKCKELSLKTNKKFKMAINLSEVQIRDEGIVDYIARALKENDLDASYIELEITESIIMESADRNIKTLERLKNLGVTLALDDFGTGYSSLNYLRILPIDVLKIDKSFIDGILIEEKSEYIINSIINLSHYLNLLVVAEGVETKDQLAYLEKSSCDIIQGYYFSKPLEFDEVSKMIIN